MKYMKYKNTMNNKMMNKSNNNEQLANTIRNIAENSCISMLRLLPEKDLIKIYDFLNNNKEENNDFNIKNGSPKDTGKVITAYKNYLESQNKANTTINDYSNEAKKFIEYLEKGKKLVDRIVVTDIDHYLSKRNKCNISNNTYIKIINCIRSFLKFLFLREYIKKDFTSLIKIPRRVETLKEILSDYDIKKIENYLNDRKEKYKNENLRDSLIFYLGVNCGLRRQEFINLNWEDIELDDCSIKIFKSKGGKSRKVYFSNKLKDLLLKYRKVTGNYTSAVIRGSHGKRISICSLQNIITKAYRESRIYRANLTLHSLRHTFADRLRGNGIDIETTRKLMGHSSIETTAIYFHSNQEDLKKAVL